MTQNNALKGLAALALIAGMTTAGQAFTSKGTQSITAGVTLSGAGSVSFSTTLKDRVTNAAGATSLSWTKVAPAPGAGFLLADQYIQLQTTMTISGAGGIQIYTDNTNGSASPKYTAPVNATSPTPAGLVASNGLSKLPTAWSISASTANPTAGDPNNTTTFSNWLYHEDKAQVANNQGGSNFANADAYITAYSAGQGLHFGSGPTQFGGFHAVDTNYIFTEADFTAATTPNTYGTNELILEAFTN